MPVPVSRTTAAKKRTQFSERDRWGRHYALPALATVAVLQAAGMVARWVGFWMGDPFEPVSLASFVLLDVLVSLFAWTSMVVLLAAGLRYRMAVLAQTHLPRKRR